MFGVKASVLFHTAPLIKRKIWELIFSHKLKNWVWFFNCPLGSFMHITHTHTRAHTQKHTPLNSYTSGMWGTILMGFTYTYKIHHSWNIALQKEGRTAQPPSYTDTHTHIHFTLATCWLDTGRGLQTELLVKGTTLSERDERSPRRAEDWATVLHTLNDENIKNKTRHTGKDTDCRCLDTHIKKCCQWPWG